MRLLVLLIALVFVVGLGILTALDIAHYGVSSINVLGVIVVALFAFGILGALTEPPRR